LDSLDYNSDSKFSVVEQDSLPGAKVKDAAEKAYIKK
jgi:hypothetical protein